MDPYKVGNDLYLPDGNGGIVIVTPDTFVVVDRSGEQREYEREAPKEEQNEHPITDRSVSES